MASLIVDIRNKRMRLIIINIESSLRYKMRQKKELSNHSEIVENLTCDIIHKVCPVWVKILLFSYIMAATICWPAELDDSFYMMIYHVKWSRYRPGVAQRVGRGIALLFHDRGTRRGWLVSSTPRPHFTPGKTQYRLYRRLRGPQGRSGRVENLIPTGIRSRIVQPVVSRYTDWANRPTYNDIALGGKKLTI